MAITFNIEREIIFKTRSIPLDCANIIIADISRPSLLRLTMLTTLPASNSFLYKSTYFLYE